MPELVLVVLIFLAAGLTLLAANLVVGRLVRPDRPSPEKGEVYECGEVPVGSAWVQFDLRFYVVALLFVIFDVEIAFFFPWAVVFGSANQLADPNLPEPQRAEARRRLEMPSPPGAKPINPFEHVRDGGPVPQEVEGGRSLARLAFAELLVFFGVLLVGFAYLWKRGDLEWVRSVASQVQAQTKPSPPAAAGGLVVGK